MTISDICIKRPVFTWVLVAIPVVLGLFSSGELGVDLFPDVDFPVCTVTTVLQGASVEEMETTVTIGDRSKMMAAVNNGPDEDNNANPSAPDASQAKLGLQVSDLPQGAPAGLHGVVVQSVKPGSFADEIGLGKGALILEINRQPVTDSDDAVRWCKAAKGDQILLKIWRRYGNAGGTQYLSVDNTKRPQ